MIDDRAFGPGTLGAFTSALAVGFVAGATVLVDLGSGRHPAMVRGYAGLALGGLACLALLLPPNQATIVLTGGIVGASFSLFDVLWDSHVQSRVDDTYLARVVGADAWVSFTLRSLGFLMAPLVGAGLGFAHGIAAAGSTFLVLLVALLSTVRGRGPMSGIAQLRSVVLDCPDPRGLAEFYRQLVGGEIIYADDEWVKLQVDGSDVRLAFQRAPDHQPPDWPNPDKPQQFHIDVTVDDVDKAEEQVLALGARRHEHQPGIESGDTFRVYLDPAGHPFCLCWD